MAQPRRRSLAGLRECPFCGVIPRDFEFCSTERGPAVICPNCGAQGPWPLKEELVGPETPELRIQATRAWNHRKAPE